MYLPTREGLLMPGASTPYVAAGCPNAEWDFGAVGTPPGRKVPKLPTLFLWDLPSFSDPFVFDLLYGHNEGVSDYLSVLQSRSAALQAEETFGRAAEQRRETFKSRSVVYTPPGIRPNFKAVMKYKSMKGRSSAYASPPIRIDFGPVGSKAKGAKLVTELPDLVKDIQFVGSLAHIRGNPHFCGNEGRREELGSLCERFRVEEMPRIGALLVDPLTNTLVVNRKAIPVTPESRILLDAVRSEVVVEEKEREADGCVVSDVEWMSEVSDVGGATGGGEIYEEEESEESSASESLESISSAWSEKSLDYESISSGRLSVEATGHVKSTWDSTSSKSSSKSSCGESSEGDYSSCSSTTEEFMEDLSS